MRTHRLMGKTTTFSMQKPVCFQELIIIARNVSTWVKAFLDLCVLCITTTAQKTIKCIHVMMWT